MTDVASQIENWLNERFAREREAMLDLVIRLLNETLRHNGEASKREFAQECQRVADLVTAAVHDILAEHIRRDGDATKREFEGEFAKLQDLFDRQQVAFDRLGGLIEQVRRIDHALVHGETVDSTKMN